MAHKAVAEIQETGGKAVYVEVDLADDESVATAARTVAEKFSALHVLVNNAAILRSGTIEGGAWIPNWEPETAIGLRGWVLITQHLLPLLKQEGGAIVNLSSEADFSADAGSGSTMPLKPDWSLSRKRWRMNSSNTVFGLMRLPRAGLLQRCTSVEHPTLPLGKRS